MSTLGKQRNGTRVVTDVVFRLGGAWEKLLLMTHILQYRAATDRQDSLADNLKVEILDTESKSKSASHPENAGKDCLGRAVQRPLVSGKLGHVLRRRRRLRALCLLRNGSDSSNSSYFFV